LAGFRLVFGLRFMVLGSFSGVFNPLFFLGFKFQGPGLSMVTVQLGCQI